MQGGLEARSQVDLGPICPAGVYGRYGGAGAGGYVPAGSRRAVRMGVTGGGFHGNDAAATCQRSRIGAGYAVNGAAAGAGVGVRVRWEAGGGQVSSWLFPIL